ncbi:MAG: DUF4180 domain-containing protein [Christensenellales bacterium]|jgi:hypothetical protein
MTIQTIAEGGASIAVVTSADALILDGQTALDFMMTVNYETGCRCIIVQKQAIAEDFFDLRTRIAGDVLQKFINYHFKLAIVGDFSGYTSKSLRDFMRESNAGRDIFFVPTKEEAIARLAQASA